LRNSLQTENEAPLIRTAYGPKLVVEIFTPPDAVGAKQSFKDECDINVLMARYLQTGLIDFVEEHEPQYGDCTGVPGDFQTAMNTVIQAETMFADMPAKLRARFENDPGKFLDFVQTDANRKEALELGLISDKRSATAEYKGRGKRASDVEPKAPKAA
jgi:phage internal scaffolding protein